MSEWNVTVMGRRVAVVELTDEQAIRFRVMLAGLGETSVGLRLAAWEGGTLTV